MSETTRAADNPPTPIDPQSAGSGHSDPYRRRALWLVVMFLVMLPALLVLLVAAQPAPPPPPWSLEAAALGVPAHEISFGQTVYRNTCAVCHGPQGEGVPRLGKPLADSAFVQGQTDRELFRLLVEGRTVADPANTTGALMPPRGAQSLDDDSIRAVMTYLRAIQTPGEATVSVAAWDLKSGDDGAGGPGAGAIELTAHAGYELFVASCAACHGQGAEGMDQLGLPLTTSGFVRGTSDKDLITFIKMGRPIWDANNTTGLDMPPKGGNPAITDEQLQSIVDYLRAVQREAMGS